MRLKIFYTAFYEYPQSKPQALYHPLMLKNELPAFQCRYIGRNMPGFGEDTIRHFR